VSFALAVGAQIEFLASNNLAGTGAMNLTGNEFANTIYGNNGANIIAGKGGNDTLFGRGGGDTFVFDTFAHTTANRDIIADFNGAQDTIRVAKSTFTKLTGNAGTLRRPVRHRPRRARCQRPHPLQQRRAHL
jgi:Ca2+-binding RTX toxin-like protein